MLPVANTMALERRALKAEFLFPRAGTALDEARILDLRSQGLGEFRFVPRLVCPAREFHRLLFTCPLCPPLRGIPVQHRQLYRCFPCFHVITVTLLGLEACGNLCILYASRNKLVNLDGLDSCPFLWRVDVSGNKVRILAVAPCAPWCSAHDACIASTAASKPGVPVELTVYGVPKRQRHRRHVPAAAAAAIHVHRRAFY